MSEFHITKEFVNFSLESQVLSSVWNYTLPQISTRQTVWELIERERRKGQRERGGGREKEGEGRR